MNIYTHCTSCKKDIKIKSNASTRPDLQIEKGDEFNVNCQNCGTMEKKHVNDTIAGTNKTILLAGAIVGIITTIFLWSFYGAIGTISIIIPLMFWQQQMSAAKGYNSYLIRRK